jgi:hypothetical protein
MALLAVAASAGVMIFLLRRMMRGMHQQDWILLRQARTRGTIISEPQSVDFILFLPSEASAAAVAAELGRDGFETSMKLAQIQYARGQKKRGEAQQGYLVTATRKVALVPAELIKLRARFSEVTAVQKGIYCGWQIAGGAVKAAASPAGQ